MRSVHHNVVSDDPSSSHSSPVLAWCPLHGTQSSTNCSTMGPSHQLPLFMNCFSMGPFHRVQSFTNRLPQRGSPTGSQVLQQTCSSMDSSLHGSTGPIRSLLQRGVPMGSQPTLGIHLLCHGVLHGLQLEICSTMGLHGLQGHSLPHHGLHHGLQENLCSSAWSSSSPSFFTELGVCRVVSLTCSHSFLLVAWRQLVASSHTNYPCSPPAIKTLPHKSNTLR